ncbi:MAG: Hsp20/alpha crystallin family protein [Phycisphaerae bacterium]|nr:Hsp20/alpha crystallin family protein [Phycisphaerae bacterium]
MVAKEIEAKKDANKKTQCTEPSVVRRYSPAVDIFEEPDAMVLVADVPGATPDGVDIQFERGNLTIEAAVRPRREDARTRYLLREYGVGNYRRTFEVNEQVDVSKITAKLENGVLTITMPKAEAVRPKKIAVKGM